MPFFCHSKQYKDKAWYFFWISIFLTFACLGVRWYLYFFKVATSLLRTPLVASFSLSEAIEFYLQAFVHIALMELIEPLICMHGKHHSVRKSFHCNFVSSLSPVIFILIWLDRIQMMHPSFSETLWVLCVPLWSHPDHRQLYHPRNHLFNAVIILWIALLSPIPACPLIPGLPKIPHCQITYSRPRWKVKVFLSFVATSCGQFGVCSKQSV